MTTREANGKFDSRTVATFRMNFSRAYTGDFWVRNDNLH